ncbi:MAG: hypothetical protein N2517_05355, partial [Ignavibacteria bacterium]|nr:hypothetical protein [Ignavibacteria bacterium]
MVFSFFILFFLIFGQNLYCQFELVGEVGDVTGNKVFIENKGQFQSETDNILCYTKLDVGNVALTISSVKFFTYGESNEVGSIKSSELIFKNVNGKAKIVYEDPVNTLYNFYLPHCPQGIVGVRGYKRIKLVNLYKDVNFIMEYLPNGQISAYFESYDINSLYQISVELDTKSKTRDG